MRRSNSKQNAPPAVRKRPPGAFSRTRGFSTAPVQPGVLQIMVRPPSGFRVTPPSTARAQQASTAPCSGSALHLSSSTFIKYPKFRSGTPSSVVCQVARSVETTSSMVDGSSPF